MVFNFLEWAIGYVCMHANLFFNMQCEQFYIIKSRTKILLNAITHYTVNTFKNIKWIIKQY